VRDWHLSPVECKNYVVLEAHMNVNTAFDAGKPLDLVLSDLEIQHSLHQGQDKPNEGIVRVHVEMKHDEKKNVPYHVRVYLAGNFSIAAAFPEEKKVLFLKTNGASILYGVARELVRDLTSRGPHSQILLPTVSFANILNLTSKKTQIDKV
jgi:preprotein translocase subunit SecB